MPVNDIIQHAMDNNPLKLKTAFDDEMTGRIRTALNTKYNDMTAEAPQVSDIETAMNSEPDHTRNESVKEVVTESAED